ncbi:MAG TPA: AraC family transcriptional regulator [Aliidongia sp.]|nr:AraC family transcriptional regulator [Aliidongia sp.]
METDPFSDVLSFVNAQSIVSGGFTAGGAWAIRFPAPDKLKFFALVKGGCWLNIDGGEAPIRVEEGDVFLLSARRSFILAADLEAFPLDAVSLFAGSHGKVTTIGEGEDCVLLGGSVRLDPACGGLLADVLPPLIHVRAASPQATVLHWLLDQLVRERNGELPGAGLAAMQLAQLIFVQILRAHLAASGTLAAGWLRAIADKRLEPALRLIHGDPGRPWQLEELAKAAAMSRTSFAQHFKAVAGVAPFAYLTAWRMRLAERALRDEDTPVSVLAGLLGYTSESAFSNAFKRATGNAPKRYRISVRKIEATSSIPTPALQERIA